ncbi:MAG: sorbosone dehydrogenase family protein [Alphaproteobacteria bacterium]|nr:sorbosone dehydrogenase family protein [Alphaproteobacteria bacterium]
MKPDQKARSVIGAVIVGMMVLALLSYVLPGTLAAYLFPGIARVSAVEGGKLTVRSPYSISTFATGVSGARLMQMTPQGDLIVSTRSSQVHLVHADKDGDGRADRVGQLIKGLDEAHGIWLEGGQLYVAEEGKVHLYRYDGVKREATFEKTLISNLPDDGGHSTRTIKKGPDGWFYVSIGSSCNVCIEDNPWRSAIIRFKPGAVPELYAEGLRNSVGFDWHPETGEMFAVNAGRDHLGDDHPREELNQIEKGKHYGWPYAHGADNTPDTEFAKHKPKGLNIEAPAHTFTAHSTPLSIRFLKHQAQTGLNGAALVALRGSWNRSEHSGYKVVLLRWGPDGKISQEDFVTGFDHAGAVVGRPVDVFETSDGTIFISDDDADVIYKLSVAAQ